MLGRTLKRLKGKTPKASDVKGLISNNATPTNLSTPIEQVIGKERLDMLGTYTKTNPFLQDPITGVEKYGTFDEPIEVPSYVGRRLVGCTGFPVDSHDLMWMWVGPEQFLLDDAGGNGGGGGGFDFDEYPPSRCLECGQAFKIKKLG